MIHSSCFVVSPGSQVVLFFALSAGWSHRRFRDHLPAHQDTHLKHGSWSGRSPSFFEMCVKLITNDCSRFNLGFEKCEAMSKKKKLDENWTHGCHNADAFAKPKMKIDRPKSYSVFTPQLKIIPGFPSVQRWILIFPNWLNREQKNHHGVPSWSLHCLRQNM